MLPARLCLPASPSTQDLPREPGRPGTLWLDDCRRTRRVFAERQLSPPLLPVPAAREFVAWMQDHGFIGERRWGGADGLWEFYLWHCDESRRHPVPDNLFAAALGTLIESRQVADYLTGKRRRLTYYMIPPPAPDLDERAPSPVAAKVRVARARPLPASVPLKQAA